MLANCWLLCSSIISSMPPFGERAKTLEIHIRKLFKEPSATSENTNLQDLFQEFVADCWLAVSDNSQSPDQKTCIEIAQLVFGSIFHHNVITLRDSVFYLRESIVVSEERVFVNLPTPKSFVKLLKGMTLLVLKTDGE